MIKCVNQDNSVESRNEEKLNKPGNSSNIQLMPGVHEKLIRIDLKHPYQEPALVPLGEKPKV